ncbi:MAG TPA: cupin domain-containing protein [Gemmatimonadaceae bacterium]|nr:cupin domain-containing protein [Gemmatimonadaceae bacterium]
MSPVRHQVSGNVLSFSLSEEIRRVRGELGAEETRIARTLVKDGPMRVTLVTMDAGGVLAEHTAAGPITIHVLQGAIEVDVTGKTWPAPTGTLLALDAGVAHAVRSRDGGLFLLTVVHPDDSGVSAS